MSPTNNFRENPSLTSSGRRSQKKLPGQVSDRTAHGASGFLTNIPQIKRLQNELRLLKDSYRSAAAASAKEAANLSGPGGVSLRDLVPAISVDSPNSARLIPTVPIEKFNLMQAKVGELTRQDKIKNFQVRDVAVRISRGKKPLQGVPGEGSRCGNS